MLRAPVLRGTKDPTLLEIAAEQGRILITHDRNTMTGHFLERLTSGKSSPGLFVIPDGPTAIGAAIEWLLLVWGTSQPEDWCDRIVYVPSR
jgi:hypothetical protein